MKTPTAAQIVPFVPLQPETAQRKPTGILTASEFVNQLVASAERDRHLAKERQKRGGRTT